MLASFGRLLVLGTVLSLGLACKHQQPETGPALPAVQAVAHEVVTIVSNDSPCPCETPRRPIVRLATRHKSCDLCQTEPIVESHMAAKLTVEPRVMNPTAIAEPPLLHEHRLATAQAVTRPVEKKVPEIEYAADYNWVKGRLEYLHIKKQWRLRYAPCDVDDPYGGVLALHGLDQLAIQPKEGMLVRVQGQLLNAETRKGSPEYFVHEIEQLD